MKFHISYMPMCVLFFTNSPKFGLTDSAKKLERQNKIKSISHY